MPPSFANAPLKRVDGGGSFPTVARTNEPSQGLAFVRNLEASFFIASPQAFRSPLLHHRNEQAILGRVPWSKAIESRHASNLAQDTFKNSPNCISQARHGFWKRLAVFQRHWHRFSP